MKQLNEKNFMVKFHNTFHQFCSGSIDEEGNCYVSSKNLEKFAFEMWLFIKVILENERRFKNECESN
jgi:hypothetical protein